MSGTKTRPAPPKNRPPVIEVMPGEITLEPIILNGQKIDLNHYFSNEYTDIEQAAQEIPPLIEWVNMQLQYCYEDKLNFKTELEEKKAKAFLDLRVSFSEKYGGKSTEEALKSAVLLDDDVQDLKRQLNVQTAWVRRLHNLQLSLQTKLDLIRSSEATRRNLIDPDPRDREQGEDEPRSRRRAEDDDDDTNNNNNS